MGGRFGETNETAFPVFEREGVPGRSFVLRGLFGDDGGVRWLSEGSALCTGLVVDDLVP